VSWTDSNGNFWLFGGYGFDSGGNYGSLNDLWEFNPTTNEWTWMGGSSTIAGATGIYGSIGVAAPEMSHLAGNTRPVGLTATATLGCSEE